MRVAATTVLFLLLITWSPLPVYGFFEFLSNLSPTKIVDNFRELISSSRRQIESEIEAHKAMLAHLETMRDFSLDEEKKLEEMASSITALMFDLPNLYTKVKSSSDQFVEHIVTLSQLQTKIGSIRSTSYLAIDEVLKRIRELMKAMHAKNEDLPPLVFELIEPERRRPEYGEAEPEGIAGNSDQAMERELFDKAFQLQKEEKFEQSYEIFMKSWRAYNRTEKLGIPHSLEEVYILDYVQYTAFKTGRIQEAYQVCQRLLNQVELTEEQRTRFTSTNKYYEQELAAESLKEMAKKIDDEPVEKQVEMANMLVATKQYDYCRDDHATESLKNLSSNPKLFCRYDNRNRNPVLLLAPVREEFISIDPLVVLLYDVILPSEVEAFKESANKTLAVAGVVNNQNYGTEIQLHTRKAKTAWIETNNMPRLTTRLEAYTGMNPYDDGCEMYQIGHYKIGGHYSPHYDTLFDAAKESGLGDRIATLLIYMNDVEEGGGTVFTDLKVRVTATARAGVFWYNFYKNETADMRTMHGACPVIRGEKWVANKWFRWRGQLLHKLHGKTSEEAFSFDDYNLTPAAILTRKERNLMGDAMPRRLS